METDRKKIRLADIDAPEKGQDFSEKSRQFLASLVAGKTVRVEGAKRDRYRRILGVVYVDGVNVNEAMVKEGLAWRYHYCKDKKIRGAASGSEAEAFKYLERSESDESIRIPEDEAKKIRIVCCKMKKFFFYLCTVFDRPLLLAVMGFNVLVFSLPCLPLEITKFLHRIWDCLSKLSVLSFIVDLFLKCIFKLKEVYMKNKIIFQNRGVYMG
jgi:hypothetical protein